MTFEYIENRIKETLENYCELNNISKAINKDTPLIGSNSILDSLGLVNIIIDIETSFLDEGIEISLTSESAMSPKISPFRSVGSLCNFIAQQLDIKNNG